MDRGKKDDIEIRDMTSSDEEGVAGLLAELNRFEAELANDRDVSEQAARKHFDYLRNEITSLGGFFLVAELKDRLVGCLVAAPESMPGFFIKPEYRDYGEIHDLFVVPELRGKGLARRLVEEAEQRFRTKGFTLVSLYALVGNTNAIEAYKRLGFDHYEVFMRKNIAE